MLGFGSLFVFIPDNYILEIGLRFGRSLMTRAGNRKLIFWGWFVLSSAVYCWLLLGSYGDYFRDLAIRIGLLGGMVVASGIILRRIWPGIQLWSAMLVSMIGYAVVYQIASYLPGINNHPFTLTWSEGSAYYFASAYFADQIYGVNFDLPLINPSRHMLMAIPFILENLPIWAHRAWEVVLWFLITGTAVYLLVMKLGIKNQLIRWVLLGWVFLYFFQGPVYYFLLISIIPVLWGFDVKRPNRTLFLVLIGSAWAGLSRVNWIPVPALLAITFYLLESPAAGRSLRSYLRLPLIWFASGVGIGLLAWFGYAQFSGQPVGNFSVYFTSNMLWYRLLPNATFPAGVLPTSILASLPLIGIILIELYRSGFNYLPVRHLGIASILLVLFVGGLIVSAKIGGGNNIHNLDAYLIILLVSGTYIFFGRSIPDFDSPPRHVSQKLINLLISIAVIIPIIFTLEGGRPVDLPEKSRTENALLTIQEFADSTLSEDGKILFIAERQLLTFGEIENVPLLPEYERMKLMEMVMGDNEDYLAEFRRRIENQEFDLIISEPLVDKLKGSSEPFGEENDVYVHEVTRPVLCYYEPVKDLFKFPIQLLIPRPESDICA